VNTCQGPGHPERLVLDLSGPDSLVAADSTAPPLDSNVYVQDDQANAPHLMSASDLANGFTFASDSTPAAGNNN
jgi:hypothetical protein